MTALEYILDGLEAELALERELGVRVVECDRSLLAAAAPGNPVDGRAACPRAAVSPANDPVSANQCGTLGERTLPAVSRPTPRPATPTLQRSSTPTLSFAFLHYAPLSAAGSEMIAKITDALGATAESAPVVVAPPLPDARVYVVLGWRALRMWFPGKNAAPGQWLRSDGGADILVTYSPEHILRFKTVTPDLQKMKRAMWNSLKEINRKLQR